MTKPRSDSPAPDVPAPTLATVRAAFAWARTRADYRRAHRAASALGPLDFLAVLNDVRAAYFRLYHERRRDHERWREHRDVIDAVERECERLGWSVRCRHQVTRAITRCLAELPRRAR